MARLGDSRAFGSFPAASSRPRDSSRRCFPRSDRRYKERHRPWRRRPSPPLAKSTMTRNSPPNWDELSAAARARFLPSDGEEEQFVQGVDAPVVDLDVDLDEVDANNDDDYDFDYDGSPSVDQGALLASFQTAREEAIRAANAAVEAQREEANRAANAAVEAQREEERRQAYTRERHARRERVRQVRADIAAREQRQAEQAQAALVAAEQAAALEEAEEVAAAQQWAAKEQAAAAAATAAQAAAEWQLVQDRNRRDAATAHRRRTMTLERIARRARAEDHRRRAAAHDAAEWQADANDA